MKADSHEQRELRIKEILAILSKKKNEPTYDDIHKIVRDNLSFYNEITRRDYEKTIMEIILYNPLWKQENKSNE